jgi:hypothetical protein
MRVCLVGPPTTTEFEGTTRGGGIRAVATYPAPGILCFAAVLERKVTLWLGDLPER